jgi:SRSO17 transposase
VKRQYSGTLGKIGTCQVTVSVHPVGQRGTLPLGWRLYLPAEWCDDLERRRKAKVPGVVSLRTKPRLAADLCERAAGWGLSAARAGRCRTCHQHVDLEQLELTARRE